MSRDVRATLKKEEKFLPGVGDDRDVVLSEADELDEELTGVDSILGLPDL